MPSWRSLTEDDCALNDAERAAYRAALLKEGATDRLPGILLAVTRYARDAIRSCRSNRLDEDAATLPESAAHHAGAIARYRLMTHFGGGVSDARTKEWEASERWLRDVAACRFLIEPPGDSGGDPASPKARPAFTSPSLTQRREDASGS